MAHRENTAQKAKDLADSQQRKLDLQQAQADEQLRARHDTIRDTFKGNKQAYAEWDEQCKRNHHRSVMQFRQSRQHDKEFAKSRQDHKAKVEEKKVELVRKDAHDSIAEVEHTLRRMGRDGSEETSANENKNQNKNLQNVVTEKSNEVFIAEIRNRKEEDLRARKDRLTRQFRMESEQARLGAEIVRKRAEETLLARARQVASREKNIALAHRAKKINKAIHKDATNELALYNNARISSEAAEIDKEHAVEMEVKRKEDNIVFAEKVKVFEADRDEFEKTRTADVEQYCRVGVEQIVNLVMKVIDHNTDCLSDGTVLYRPSTIPVTTWRQMTAHQLSASSMEVTKARMQRQAARELKGRKKFTLSGGTLTSGVLSTMSGTDGSIEAMSQVSGSMYSPTGLYSSRKSVAEQSQTGFEGNLNQSNTNQGGASTETGGGGGGGDIASAMMEEVERFLATTAAFDASQNMTMFDAALKPHFTPEPRDPNSSHVTERKSVFFVAGPELSGIDTFTGEAVDTQRFEVITLAGLEHKRQQLTRAEFRDPQASATTGGASKSKASNKKGAAAAAAHADTPPPGEGPGSQSQGGAEIPSLLRLTAQTIVEHVAGCLKVERQQLEQQREFDTKVAQYQADMKENPAQELEEPVLNSEDLIPDPKALILVGFHGLILGTVPHTVGATSSDDFLQDLYSELQLEQAKQPPLEGEDPLVEAGGNITLESRIHGVFVHEGLRTAVRRYQGASQGQAAPLGGGDTPMSPASPASPIAAATVGGAHMVKFHKISAPAPAGHATTTLRLSFDDVYSLSHKGISDCKASYHRFGALGEALRPAPGNALPFSSSLAVNAHHDQDDASLQSYTQLVYETIGQSVEIVKSLPDTSAEVAEDNFTDAWPLANRQQFIARLAVLYQTLRENEVRNAVFVRRCTAELIDVLGQSYDGFDFQWPKPERWSFCDAQRREDMERMTQCLQRSIKKSNSCRALNIVAMSGVLINNAQQVADVFFPPPVLASALKGDGGTATPAHGAEGGSVSDDNETPRTHAGDPLMLAVHVPLPDLSALESQLVEGEDPVQLASDCWYSTLDMIQKVTAIHLMEHPAVNSQFSVEDFTKAWGALCPQLLDLALTEFKTQVNALNKLVHCANVWSLRRYSECSNNGTVLAAPSCAAELLTAVATKKPAPLEPSERNALTQFHLHHLMTHLRRACQGRSAANGESGGEVVVKQEEFVHGLLSAQVSLLGLYLDEDDLDEEDDGGSKRNSNTADESVFLPHWWCRYGGEENELDTSLPLYNANHLEESFTKLISPVASAEGAEPASSLTYWLVQFVLGRRMVMGDGVAYKAALAPISSARAFGAALGQRATVTFETFQELPFWFAPGAATGASSIKTLKTATPTPTAKTYKLLLQNLWDALAFDPALAAEEGTAPTTRGVTPGNLLRLVVAPDQTNLKSLEKVVAFCGEAMGGAAPAVGGAKIHPSTLLELYPTCFEAEDFDVLLGTNGSAKTGGVPGVNTVTLSSSHWAKAMLKKMPVVHNRSLPL